MMQTKRIRWNVIRIVVLAMCFGLSFCACGKKSPKEKEPVDAVGAKDQNGKTGDDASGAGDENDLTGLDGAEAGDGEQGKDGNAEKDDAEQDKDGNTAKDNTEQGKDGNAEKDSAEQDKDGNAEKDNAEQGKDGNVAESTKKGSILRTFFKTFEKEIAAKKHHIFIRQVNAMITEEKEYFVDGKKLRLNQSMEINDFGAVRTHSFLLDGVGYFFDPDRKIGLVSSAARDLVTIKEPIAFLLMKELQAFSEEVVAQKVQYQGKSMLCETYRDGAGTVYKVYFDQENPKELYAECDPIRVEVRILSDIPAGIFEIPKDCVDGDGKPIN